MPHKHSIELYLTVYMPICFTNIPSMLYYMHYIDPQAHYRKCILSTHVLGDSLTSVHSIYSVSCVIYRPNRIMPYANSINLYCPTSNISIYTVLCILYRFVQHYVHSIDLSICFAPITSIYTGLCNNSRSSSHCYNVLSRTFPAGYF